MIEQPTLYLAWALLAIFLVVGLVLYEWTGLRLGGVLVLPLLLVYALLDLKVLIVFGIASVATLVVGHYLYDRTYLYGRRLLYVFLVVGIASSLLAKQMVDVALTGLVVALLPGLFAYNIHREGRYLEGITAFATWLGLLLVVGVAIAYGVTHDAPVAAAPFLHAASQTMPLTGDSAVALGAAGSQSLHLLHDGGGAE